MFSIHGFLVHFLEFFHLFINFSLDFFLRTSRAHGQLTSFRSLDEVKFTDTRGVDEVLYVTELYPHPSSVATGQSREELDHRRVLPQLHITNHRPNVTREVFRIELWYKYISLSSSLPLSFSFTYTLTTALVQVHL